MITKYGIKSRCRKACPTHRRLLQAIGFACLSTAAFSSARAQTTYTWDGGTGNWSDSSMWSLMMAPNDPSADVYIDGGNPVNSVVTLDGDFTVGRLTVDAGDTLNIANDEILYFQSGSFTGSGTIINNGTINLNSTGNGDDLRFVGANETLAGTGTINMNGAGNRIFAQNGNNDRLTISAGATIAGTGNLGIAQSSFTNNGTVNANQSGNTLTLQPGGDFTNGATGIAEASNGGTLALIGGTFAGSGTFQALAGSNVTIGSNATVSGTTLATTGSGTVTLTDTATLTNVTNSGTLNAANDSTTYITGTFTNNGTFDLNSTGNGDDLKFTGNGVILAGTGTINLNGVGDRIFATNGNNDRLVINAGATIAGTGNLGIAQSSFTNNGIVNANQSGLTLTLQPGGDFTNGTVATTGFTGVTEASNGGTLALIGGNFVNGTFQALAGSNVTIGSNATVTGATLATTGSGTVTLTDTATLTNATNTGTLNAANNSTTYVTGTLTNNGTFNLNSTGNGDDIRFVGNGVVLAGTGTLNLNGVADRIFAQNGNGDHLIISAGSTIAGTGNLGVNQSGFTNSGTVNANQSGLTLTLQPSSDFTTLAGGVAEATNGGTLALLGGASFTGPGGFTAATGSTVTLMGNPNVNATTLASTGTGTVVILDNASLTNVTLVGTLNAANNSTTYLTGTLTNNGTFNLNSTANGDDIRFVGNGVTLAGTGTINLNGPGDRIFAQNGNGDHLIISAGSTIAGTGNLGINQSGFTNSGTVNANQSGLTLTLQPSSDFTTLAGGVTEATNGGTLALLGGASFTGPGGFTAATGSTVTLMGNPNVNATTLASTGTGTVVILDNASLTNVTLAGTVNGTNDSTTYIAGTLTNNATFNENSTANGNDIRFVGNGVTLAGTGTINLNGPGDRIYANNGNNDRLIINTGATIAGTGNLGVAQSSFTNNGTVNANQSGNTLTLQPGGDFTTGATGVTEATGGGVMVQTGGSFTNNGTYAVISGSTGGSSSLSVDAGHLTNFAGTTLTGGTYDVISTSTANTSTLSFGGGTISTNAANVVLSGANTVFNEINGLGSNQGSFTVANGRNFTTTGALANSGTLVSAGGSTLTVTGALTQSTTGTIAGNGAYTAPGGFTIAGNVNPGGTVSATTGAFTGGPGTMTLNSGSTADTETTFTVDAQFHFELGTTTGTNDRIAVNGLLNLNGTLNVAALAGFGTGTYDLIDYPALDYTYLLAHDTLTLGSLPAGYTYLLSNAVPGQVDLVVVQNVPEPETWAFLLGGATLLLGARRLRRAALRRG